MLYLSMKQISWIPNWYFIILHVTQVIILTQGVCVGRYSDRRIKLYHFHFEYLISYVLVFILDIFPVILKGSWSKKTLCSTYTVWTFFESSTVNLFIHNSRLIKKCFKLQIPTIFCTLFICTRILKIHIILVTIYLISSEGLFFI